MMNDAEDAKRHAMQEVDLAANEAWKLACEIAVLQAAKALPELTSDDVVERIPDDVHTHELRAVGPVMMRAAKWGWIIKVNCAPRNSRRRSLHASPRTVWKSLIYGT